MREAQTRNLEILRCAIAHRSSLLRAPRNDGRGASSQLLPRQFRAAWEEGNGVTNVRAGDIDAVLHRERLEGASKRSHALPAPLRGLPDGAMVQAGEESFLIAQGRARVWSPAGYRQAQGTIKSAMLLTPPSTLRAFSAGYRPVLHRSVKD